MICILKLYTQDGSGVGGAESQSHYYELAEGSHKPLDTVPESLRIQAVTFMELTVSAGSFRLPLPDITF